MSLYSLISVVLTVVGYLVLVYKIIYELQSHKSHKQTLQKLCTKWLIFTIFLKIQNYLAALMQIIPFGTLLLLIIKILLFLPQNAISHMIYKKIQRKLDKIKLEQYNSKIGQYLSLVSKIIATLLMKIIKKISPYINSKDIETVEIHILDIIKILEYKKAAINVRSQALASQINQQLNTTQFNISRMDDDVHIDQHLHKKYEKSKIGNQMSQILADDDDDQETMKLQANVMIVKPEKSKNIKAQYEEVSIQYYLMTSKIQLTNSNHAVQYGTLKEVRWVTKNMMNIELVLNEGRSKIIKLKDNSDVVKWVQPVCLNVDKIREQAKSRKQ